jgi:site-specific DNA recombinase
MNDQSAQLIPPLRTTRFITLPTLAVAHDEIKLRAYLAPSHRQEVHELGSISIMRYAAYIRVSHEEQVNGYSLDAQRREIQTWITAKGGALTKVYAEEGESGTSANRTAFQQMRLDARNGKFDALVVHKLDRFARNRTDSLAIKSLLRYDYKIKVFSVSEPTEDSDGPIGALIEGIMECVAEWYSRNLAAEVAKGKRERGKQGLHNNRPPFGYDKDESKVLIINEHEAIGLVLAFTEYATGRYSDNDIAQLLIQAGYLSKNARPFSKETVREMLQNRTYLGKVRYQKYDKKTTRKNRANVPEDCWFEGQHQSIITEELFNQCLTVRKERVTNHQPVLKHRLYLLKDLLYCYHCVSHPPADYSFPTYGKLRVQTVKRSYGEYSYYTCRSRDFNVECPQKTVASESIEHQVIALLMNLTPPQEWREHITEAMSALLGERNLEERLAEINETINRMDFRWDQGFITDKIEYLEKRVQLQQELESLTPIQEDDLEQAADMLLNFRKHWEACSGDVLEQQKLIKLIVERIYIEGDRVVAMTLKADYHIVLNHKTKEPTDFSIDSFVYQNGDDGIRTRGLCLDRAIC